MGVPVTQTRAAEFRETLGKRALVADGAMGTMLYSKLNSIGAHRCTDELNLSLPALVRDVHREYVRAGAEILRTNTFGANRPRLESFGFTEKIRQINQAGVRIAREAGRDRAGVLGQGFVAGAVGPLGSRLEPLGSTTCAEARAYFREQIEALVEAGVDLLVLETFRDCGELREAIFTAREAAGPEMVIAAHVSVEDDGTLADGASIESFTRRMDEWPVDVIGLNCSAGPRVVFDTIEKMTAFTGKPLSAMPSAGLPGAVCSPGYVAQYARRFLRAGVKIIGGCCGTTPEHIRAIRNEVDGYQPEPLAHVRISVAPIPSRDGDGAVVLLAEKSQLGAKLAAGRFVTLVEIQPPRGADAFREIENAKQYKAAGIDAVTVPDGPGGRLNAQATCQLIQQRAGIETVLRFGGHGRSTQTIQSELMGAHAVGLRNILCTGDDAAAAASIANNLNRGLDRGGNPIGSPTALVLGVEVNPASLDQLEAKVRAGAEYVVAQPVFDLDVFEAFLKHTEQYKLPVVAGIWLLTSFRDGEFMINERNVPVPPPYMARLSVAQKGAQEEGVAIAIEIMERVRSTVAGVQLSGPFGAAVQVAEAIGPR
jgi:methionine synthase / methylenetetrahydrofolate reductase(NADPH)